MHVCVGGVSHSFVLHWKLRRWNVCLPAVLSTEGDGREWGAHQAQLLTHSHLLLWGRGCICSCMLGLKRGSHNDIPPLPSPTLASHAYLVLQMQSCLLSFCYARCFNLSLCPIPPWTGTKGWYGNTRGLLSVSGRGMGGDADVSVQRLPSDWACAAYVLVSFLLQMQEKVSHHKWLIF